MCCWTQILLYTHLDLYTKHKNIEYNSNIGKETGITEGRPTPPPNFHFLVEEGTRRGEINLPVERMPELWCHCQKGAIPSCHPPSFRRQGTQSRVSGDDHSGWAVYKEEDNLSGMLIPNSIMPAFFVKPSGFKLLPFLSQFQFL